jgi:Crp-like helix-turn-helix domain
MRDKRKAAETVFFDRTGVVVPVVVPNAPRPQRGPMYSYIGGFVVVSIDGMRKLAKMRLGGQTLRVLFCLFERLDGNVVHNAPTMLLADRLGVANSSVSRALTELEGIGVIKRGLVRGVLILNPHYGFLGSAVAQRKAVKEWDADNKPIPVPRDAA